MSIFIDLKTERWLKDYKTAHNVIPPQWICIFHIHTKAERDFWKVVHQNVNNGYI